MYDLVSVVVPVYKVEKYLKRCVNSIIAQSYANLEIILIDDGSPDNCPELCDYYVGIDSRVRVIHKNNAGVSAARNTGILNSTGEYILFVDSDDYIKESMVENMIAEMKESETDVCVCGFESIDSSNRINNYKQMNASYSGCFKKFVDVNFIELYDQFLINPPWNKLIRKRVLIENNIEFYESLSINEDVLFSIQVLHKCNRLSVIKDCYYSYCQNDQPNSLTNKFHPNGLDSCFLLKDALIECLADKKSSIDTLRVMKDRMFLKFIGFIIAMYKLSNYSNEKCYQVLKQLINDERFYELIDYVEFNGLRLRRKVGVFALKHKLYILYHWMCLLSCRYNKNKL